MNSSQNALENTRPAAHGKGESFHRRQWLKSEMIIDLQGSVWFSEGFVQALHNDDDDDDDNL